MRSLTFVAWGLSITAGALWIRFARPQQHLPFLSTLIASEPVHVFAHATLYGALAWLCSRRLRLRWVLPTVLGLGLVQELAQVLGVRPLGGPEVFDLAVDGAAAVVVVAIVWWRRRDVAGAAGRIPRTTLRDSSSL